MRALAHPVLLLLLLSVGVAPLQAAPMLSAQQTRQLNALCQGMGALTATTLQRGILAYDPSRSRVSPLHDHLPSSIRADSFATTGLVLCVQESRTFIETCTINVFFTLPRLRLAYETQPRPVRNPQKLLGTGVSLYGSDPPPCSNPGPISNGQTSLDGALPPISEWLDLLTSISISAQDHDEDGYSNVAEWIEGSELSDRTSPGPSAQVSINGSHSLSASEGEALTIQLTVQPAAKKGLPTDYFVWAEARGATYTYVYPTGFRLAPKQLALRAPAIQLNNFPLVTLPGLGVGDYTVHFQAMIDDGTVLESTAKLQVSPSQWKFVEVSKTAGLKHRHGFKQIAGGIARDRQFMVAGVAAGDFDNDGWTDLYVTRGSIGPNLLYRNLGDGSFVDVAATAGVAIDGEENSGATFADYDGDGYLDLLVAGINQDEQPHLFHNERNGSFTEVTASAGIPLISQSMSSSFADYDKDGDLDFWITHWSADTQQNYLFRNNANGTFSDISRSAGIANDLMNDFTANFADINNDSWLDVVVAADFKTSQVYLNQRNGSLLRATNAVISDENGMGGAVADYDNDGDLDWFVSSIYDDRPSTLGIPPGQLGISWGQSGNRFYRNRGDGSFEDVTTLTGTRSGGWGWGSCFADFNNDGHLDLFHVNGYDSSVLASNIPFPFRTDASRLFISDHKGSFTERAVELGINDNMQGRGIVCFDYDRDGDIDLFVANNEQEPLLYENQGLKAHWLQVRVGGEQLNSEAIGARVYVTVNGLTQMRELSAGSNYMSQNPVIAHFGLGGSTVIERVRVLWPSGAEKILSNVTADQLLEVDK